MNRTILAIATTAAIVAAIPASAFAQQSTATSPLTATERPGTRTPTATSPRVCIHPDLYCRHAYLPVVRRPPPPTPRPTATPTPTPIPTNTPLPPVMILPSDSTIVTDHGELWVLGEVQNNTASTLSDIVVHAKLFDAAGRLLNWHADALEQLDGLPMGQRACFAVTFETDPPGRSFHRYEIDYMDLGVRAAVLDTANVSGGAVRRDDGNADYRIIGQVRNGNAFAVENPQVTGTLYGPHGGVVGCRYDTPAFGLASGQQSAFELLYSSGWDKPKSDVASFRLLALGRQR